MTKRGILKETDPDVAAALPALKRAAANALKLSIRTNTPFYVFIDGEIVDLLDGEPEPEALLREYQRRATEDLV
jgi:hypothetical protein